VVKTADLGDLRLHDLRHSFTSKLVSSGASLALIGSLLGHSRNVVKTADLGDLRLHDLRHNSGNRIIPSTDRQQLYFGENRGVAGT
jgi:site-specific recombinase XerD